MKKNIRDKTEAMPNGAKIKKCVFVSTNRQLERRLSLDRGAARPPRRGRRRMADEEEKRTGRDARAWDGEAYICEVQAIFREYLLMSDLSCSSGEGRNDLCEAIATAGTQVGLKRSFL